MGEEREQKVLERRKWPRRGRRDKENVKRARKLFCIDRARRGTISMQSIAIGRILKFCG